MEIPRHTPGPRHQGQRPPGQHSRDRPCRRSLAALAAAPRCLPETRLGQKEAEPVSNNRRHAEPEQAV